MCQDVCMETKPTYEQLAAENAALKATIEKQQAMIARMQKRLEELERSGKRQASPFAKGPPKADPKRPGRKSGDAHGSHYFREKPARIDEILEAALPSQCPHCGGTDWQCMDTSVQYQTDIPRQVVNRQFNIQSAQCGSCGKQSRGRHPLQTSDATGAAGVQWGANALALAAMLNKECGMPHGKIKRVFEAAFDQPMGRATSCRALSRIAVKLEGARDAIAAEIISSPKVVPDETGWNINGILHWLHVFATPSAVLYLIRPGRGFEVSAEALGADYAGQLIHDGWRPYMQFTLAIHQTCLAHILRRCGNLIESLPPGAAKFPKAVKELIGIGLELRDKRERKEIGAAEAAEGGRALERELDALSRNKKLNPQNQTFAKFIRQNLTAFFAFLLHAGMDATNSRAERMIRPMVVNRKVCGGNRTSNGAWAQEVIGTVLFTALLRKISGFDFIVQTLHAPPDQINFLPPPRHKFPRRQAPARATSGVVPSRSVNRYH